MADKPNLLLVTVDSLRADYTYGEKAATPTFDSLAEAGTAFTSAFAQGPYTTFSMPSLFTSRYPSQLTSIDFVDGVEGVLVENASTIQERLHAAGYTTAGIHTNPLLSELFGFDVGFDHFHDGLGGVSDRLPGKFKLLADKVGRLIRRHPYVPADKLTDRAVEWLQANESEPFFLWVHYMDVHGPYQSKDGFQYLEKYRSETLWRKAVNSPSKVTERERERLRETYRQEVEFTDQAVGRLLEAFDTATGTTESMSVLTSDHGDELFEHGSFSHESKLYDELIHVPLVVDPPSGESPERDVESLVPLLDVGPTLLNAAGASTDSSEGTSLITPDEDERGDSDSEGERSQEMIIAEAQLEPAYIGAVRTPKWKFIERDGQPELYNLVNDPAEQTNVADEESNIRRRLEELMADHRDRYTGEHRYEEHLESTQLNDQLQSLGYLE